MNNEVMTEIYTLEEIAKMAAERHISYGKMVLMLEREKIAAGVHIPPEKKVPVSANGKALPRRKTKKVKVLDKEGNVIKRYNSSKEAAGDMTVSLAVVSSDCRGKNQNPFVHRDFRFCYDEE